MILRALALGSFPATYYPWGVFQDGCQVSCIVVMQVCASSPAVEMLEVTACPPRVMVIVASMSRGSHKPANPLSKVCMFSSKIVSPVSESVTTTTTSAFRNSPTQLVGLW